MPRHATRGMDGAGMLQNSQVDLESRLAQAERELAEAREQQAAAAENLRVISGSPAELASVFQAVLANAVRLCEAKFGNLYLNEGGAVRLVASHNAPPAFVEARRRGGPVRPAAGAPLGEVIRTKQSFQV